MSATDDPGVQITPEDIHTQFMVARTKDHRVAVLFPTKDDGGIDILEALKLLATGLNYVVDTLHQQQVPAAEKPEPEVRRIVLAPAIPKEFLTRNRPD
jgi:hypothetical protein